MDYSLLFIVVVELMSYFDLIRVMTLSTIEPIVNFRPFFSFEPSYFVVASFEVVFYYFMVEVVFSSVVAHQLQVFVMGKSDQKVVCPLLINFNLHYLLD